MNNQFQDGTHLLIIDGIDDTQNGTEWRGVGHSLSWASIEAVADNIAQIADKVQHAIAALGKAGNALAEVQIKIGVTASGRLCIFGSGAGTEAEAAITLIFRPPNFR